MATTSVHPANAKEADYWNGPAGQLWVEHQERQDELFRPISDRLMGVAAPRPGEFVVDVGCGSGATTIELASRVAPTGEVLGLDVSATLLKRARERAPEDLPVRFVHGDATVHQLPPGQIDLVASRFGVMFFADPAQAFANLRRGMKPGGRVAFVCWRAAKANPWMIVPLRAAAIHAPPLPELGPEDPGPFAFADETRVRRVLGEAGFVDIALHPEEFELDVAGGRGIDVAVEAALSIGPTSRMLKQQSEEVRAAAVSSIRSALAAHAVGDRVPLGAAVWFVTAKNPGTE